MQQSPVATLAEGVRFLGHTCNAAFTARLQDRGERRHITTLPPSGNDISTIQEAFRKFGALAAEVRMQNLP